MLDGAENGRFGTIKTKLENNMTCGSDIYPNTKDETVGLLKNYRVSKKLTQANPVREEVVFTQTSSNTKISNTNSVGESDCFH